MSTTTIATAASLDQLDVQSRLSKTWRVFGKHEITYTGGPIVYTKDMTHLVSVHGEDPTKIIFFRIKSGQVVHSIECGEEDPIGSFTLSPNQQLLYTFHIRSSLIKVWNIETKLLSHQFKSDHKSDVVSIECDPTGTLLATASLDQTVRIRYATNGHLTHYFTNHGSPITTMTWHPSIEKLLLVVGTQNGTIRVHWLGNGETGNNTKYIDLLRADYDGTPNKSHVSKVTALSWSHCQTKLVSVGYDKMWRVWDFCYENNTILQLSKQPRRSIDMLQHLNPAISLSCTEIASHLILDELENVSVIPFGTSVPMRKKDSNEYVSRVLEEENNCVYFLTSGTRGVTSIWKVNYDYMLKKKSIGIIFKHLSIQSYQSNNIPFNNITYENKLYAQTPEQLASQQQDDKKGSADDQHLFETLLHLQWHKMQLFVPPSMILSPITTTTTKTITLKDGSKIQRQVTRPQQSDRLPQLPKLDSDVAYENRLLDEKKYYESQQLISKKNNFQIELRKQQKLDSILDSMSDEKKTNDDHDDDKDHIEAEATLFQEGGDEDQKDEHDAEITAKLQEFRGLPPTTPQLYLLNGDHNLYMFNLSNFNKDKVFTFYQQQINDVKVIPNTRCVLVATNSKQLRLFNVDTLHCDILFPHSDIIISTTISSCGRFAMSSTISGEIYVWVLYHYDEDGYIPPAQTRAKKIGSSNLTQEMNNNDTPTDDEESDAPHNDKEFIGTRPKPYKKARRATHISAHVVAELKGHKEAPSALCFSHDQSPHYDYGLSITSHLDQANTTSPQHDNIYNYNRLQLFACTAGSDRAVRTWNLSSLYIFTDPLLYTQWAQISQRYQAHNKLHGGVALREDIINMSSLRDHIFVQLWDKSIVNASYVLYHNLLSLSPTQNTAMAFLQPTRITFAPITTTLAHDKDINALTIHPNNQLIATCSEDKTCKLWKYTMSTTNATSLQLVGVLKGHRRTIWNMLFTPRDKYVITVSSDKLIKVWSTQDLSCVATIQGHTSAVVNCTWIRYGMQFITADTNGILRLWNLNESTFTSGGGDCVAVCDEPHDCRINGLDVDHYHGDSFMVTGDSASTLVFWHDTTLYDEMMAQQQQQSQQLQEQMLENALQRKEYERSFELALKLQHTRRLYFILTEIIDLEQRYKRSKALSTQRNLQRAQLRALKIKQAQKTGNISYDPDEDPDIVGQEEIFLMLEARENLELKVAKPKVTIEKLLKKRNIEELELLTNLLLDWNTNSKFSFTTQYVLSTIFKTLEPLILAKIPKLADKLCAFIAYTQRHYTRVNSLLQSSYLVDHVLSNMNIYMPLHDYDRASKVLQAQMSNIGGNIDIDENGEKENNTASLLSLTTDNDVLQSILSLYVDDSLLLYETISDDEGDYVSGLDAASRLALSMNQKQPLRYFIDESNEDDPGYVDDDDNDDGYDNNDDGYDNNDDDEGAVNPFQEEELDGIDANDPFVMLPPVSGLSEKKNTNTIVPKFDFDSMCGDFGDDWEVQGEKMNDNKIVSPPARIDDTAMVDDIDVIIPSLTTTTSKKSKKNNKSDTIALGAGKKRKATAEAQISVRVQEKPKSNENSKPAPKNVAAKEKTRYAAKDTSPPTKAPTKAKTSKTQK